MGNNLADTQRGISSEISAAFLEIDDARQQNAATLAARISSLEKKPPLDTRSKANPDDELEILQARVDALSEIDLEVLRATSTEMCNHLDVIDAMIQSSAHSDNGLVYKPNDDPFVVASPLPLGTISPPQRGDKRRACTKDKLGSSLVRVPCIRLF